MNAADFDDDDAPAPLPADRGFRADYGEPPGYTEPAHARPRSEFGFGIAVVWCLLFLAVTQILAGLVFGIPIIIIASVIKAAQNQPVPLDTAGMMKDPVLGPAVVLILVCSHLAGLLFGWLILRWQCGKQAWKRRIALTRGPSLTHAALVLIGFPAMLALGSAMEQPIMRYVPSVQDMLNYFNIPFEWPGIEAVQPLLENTPWPLALFAVAVLPAVNEEFWCRGFLGQGLAARYSGWVAVLATSFLFGCIHLEPRQGLWAMFFGAVIHAAYLATRSLWVAMGIHCLNNGLAVVHSNVRLWPVLEPLELALKENPVAFVAAGLCLFGAVAYALYQTRCRIVPTVEGLEGWQPDGDGSAELPPPNSGSVVAHEPLSPVSAALVVAGAVAFGAMLVLV